MDDLKSLSKTILIVLLVFMLVYPISTYTKYSDFSEMPPISSVDGQKNEYRTKQYRHNQEIIKGKDSEENQKSKYFRNMHITSESSFTNSVTITWETDFPTNSVIFYDTLSSSSPLNYRSYSTGITFTYEDASGYIHMVKLENLNPDTTYYFRCLGKDRWSNERSFKTAPDIATNFSFVVGGDSQDLNLFTGRNYFSNISCAMAKFNPSFVVLLGDIVHKGDNQNHWNIWFEDVSENWTVNSSPSEISSDTEGRSIPVIPVLGNHEKNDTKYYMQFALPNNEQWYYYDWGNVRIIVLNTDALPSQIKEDQTIWLEDVLKSTPSSMWKMVFFHRNIYGAAGWDDSDEIIDYWIPLFDKYNVTAVFNGHIHNYHRYKPMKDNKVVSTYEKGTLYITTGGWGSKRTQYHEKSYSAYGKTRYHFVLVRVYNNVSIHIEAKDIDGETFDSVWLTS